MKNNEAPKWGKSFLQLGGIKRYQTGNTPKVATELVMVDGQLVNVPLNSTAEERQRIADEAKQKAAAKETPKETPKVVVEEEPEFVPKPSPTPRPAPAPSPPAEPGVISPASRTRVNYDTQTAAPRHIRENVQISGETATDGWYSADDLRARNDSLAGLPYEDMIAASRAIYAPDERYLMSNKEKGTYGVYQGGNLIAEYEGLMGANSGDAITNVPDKYPDIRGYQPDYSAGNLNSGAGEFFLSASSPNSKDKYNNAPSFNFALPGGQSQGMSIHGTPQSRLQYYENENAEDNRQTYGCVNGLCGDLKELFEMGLEPGTSWYSLPEDDRNKFTIIDGQPFLKSSLAAREEALNYEDYAGNTRRGQGMNVLNRTMPGYREIRANIDTEAFQRDIYNEQGFADRFTGDTTDEEEFQQTTVPYTNSLVANKQKIMQATGVTNDEYNAIAKVAFGILGAESTFGDTNSMINNATRAAAKGAGLSETNMDTQSEQDLFLNLDRIGSGISDVGKSIGADNIVGQGLIAAGSVLGSKDPENYSLGPTQLRWNSLTGKNSKGEVIDEDLKFLQSLGINGPEDLTDPETAALATAGLLAFRSKRRGSVLNAETFEDKMRALAETWNDREGYADRVIKNSQYLNIEQKDRMKKGGKRKSKYFKLSNRLRKS